MGPVRRTRSTTGKRSISLAAEEERRERASPEETSDQQDGPLRLVPRSFREELGLTPQAVTSIDDPTPFPEQRPISAPVNISVPSSFEKLEGAKNYMDWCFAMEAHLFSCELWEYVDGLKEDSHLNKRARCAIVSGIKANLFSSIRYADSGKAIWNQLQNLYQPRGLHQEVALLEALTSITFGECLGMEAYISGKIIAALR